MLPGEHVLIGLLAEDYGAHEVHPVIRCVQAEFGVVEDAEPRDELHHINGVFSDDGGDDFREGAAVLVMLPCSSE